MNVIDLDGNTSRLKLTGYTIGINNRDSRSKYHLSARQLLKEKHPTLQILEEVSIKIRKGETLYLDFFIPLLNHAIEVHGQQHYKFSPFFHGSHMEYLKQLKRDREKKEWCEINNVEFTVLAYDEMENWIKQI